MRRVSAADQIGDQGDDARHKPLAPLSFTIERLDRALGVGSLVGGSRDAAFPFAAIYSVAGLIFGIVATCLSFALSHTEFLPLWTACVIWVYAWPIVLTLNLLWSSDRRRQLAVIALFAGVIALFCLWSASSDSRRTTIATITFPAFANPVLVWGLLAAPSLFLLLFLNRTVRAVGPVLLIFGSLVFLGWHLATATLRTPVGMRAAGWVFVSTDIGAGALWYGVIGVGLAIGAVFGWLVVDRVAVAYAGRRFSEQMLIVDSIWLLQALLLCSDLSFEVGYWGAAALLPFVVYKIVTVVGFRAFSGRLDRHPHRLLLLRVFGFSRRSSRLMDLIAARWRYIGNICLIAAPDLAARTIERASFSPFCADVWGGCSSTTAPSSNGA